MSNSSYWQLKKLQDTVDRQNNTMLWVLLLLCFGGPASAGFGLLLSVLGWSFGIAMLLTLAVLPFIGLYKFGRWLEDRAALRRYNAHQDYLDREWERKNGRPLFPRDGFLPAQ